MKRLVILLALAGCAGVQSPQVEAAEAIVAMAEAGHAVEPELLAQARAVLAEQPDPWWLTLLYGAASAYGVQALLPRRGRQLVGAALRNGARLNLGGVAASLAPLVLGTHSGRVLNDKPMASDGQISHAPHHTHAPAAARQSSPLPGHAPDAG